MQNKGILAHFQVDLSSNENEDMCSIRALKSSSERAHTN